MRYLLVVEQDTLRHLSGLETAAVSYLNLKEMGLTVTQSPQAQANS